jgi:hypothetical protein
MRRSLIALVLTASIATLIPSALAAPRRRAVVPPSAPILSAVIGSEATATNYGSTPSLVQRCVDDQPCITDALQPGETKRYDLTGQILRIGPTDAGTVAIESDGLTLPRPLFLMGTKIVPGTYDLAAFTQTILLISDHAGALGLKSVGPNGTTQEVITVPYDRGVTRIDPSTTFLNIDPDFQFEITDSVALAIEWRSKTTGTVTRIPAVRVEDALVDASLAHVTPTTTLLVKNALLVQQGGINLFFQPTTGLASLTFGRGAPLQPYGMISITDVPVFAGSSGEGSLRLQGAPEAPTFQPSDPFYAWAITDGTPYPVTSVQLAASAHATCAPTLATYHNLRWNGLRTDSNHHTDVILQNTISQSVTGTLTLDENGTVFAAQTISLAGYASARSTLDALAGTHTVFNATLQLNDTDKTSCDNPFVTGLAIVTGPNGTNVRAPVTVPRPTAYDVTATIQVRDNGQTFEQVTHPSIGTVLKLTSASNADALVGSHGYDCAPSPDPVVNSIPELLAHYAMLTPAEQQEFSGDREGFAPFAANGCDATKSQYVLFISITVTKRAPAKVTGEQVAQAFFDPAVAAGGYYLTNDMTYCMLNGSCGVPSVKSQLAALYARGIGETWSTTTFAQWLTTIADGTTAPSNIELWHGAKPRSWSPAGVSYALTTSQSIFTNEPGGIRLTPADADAHRVLDRAFLVQYFDANPAKGCGTPETGPSLNPDCPAYSFRSQAETQTGTSEQYVAKWYDTITSNIIYLDGRESRCLINGNCGTRSYAPDLAAALYPTSKYPGTVSEFETFLRGLADGDPANGELYRQKDPIKISGQPVAQYHIFSLDPNDGVINIDLSTNTGAVLAVYRAFLVAMTSVHPEEYGGTSTTGLNLALAPGWDTRHNNDTNGYRLP